jgi:hypothetical protein
MARIGTSAEIMAHIASLRPPEPVYRDKWRVRKVNVRWVIERQTHEGGEWHFCGWRKEEKAARTEARRLRRFK